jgi:branched-chain amino acid transport system substrate-binding protein
LAEPGDANDDRTIWIGAMFPRTGDDGDNFGRSNTNAVALARRDFQEVTRGIPMTSGDAPPRPLGVIACDDATDARASATHLADALGVSAVIGFKSSAEAIELARDIFVPRGVMVVATNPSAQVTQVPQPRDTPRLVWRTAPVSTLKALPAARVVSELIEPRLRSSGAVGGGEPIRVAFVRQKNQFGLSMAEAIAKNLSFNGKPALANGENFAQIVYDDPNLPAAAPDYGPVVQQLLKLAPHVIVYAGAEELVANVFAPVERSVRASARHPYWVSVTNLLGKPLYSFLANDGERRRRFFGVSAPENSPANAQLAMHYSSEFAPIDVNDTPAAAYDAAYLIAYAAYAAGGGPATGRALAGALGRLLPPGTPIDVGPTHIFEAIDALRRSERIDLSGADTRLDFDLASGETTVDLVIQCFGVDPRGYARDAIESGMTFDASSGRLRGDLRCP